ncbi:MAG TPA: DUF222 domain-containing protein [Candidatus Tectomicrobia bacterium]|nr:DUF222 domain-containing protein [Candidatus Tectomicrobia bacterium]
MCRRYDQGADQWKDSPPCPRSRPEPVWPTARRHRSRELRIYEDADGMVVIRGRLEPEVGAVVKRALEAVGDQLYEQARRQYAAAVAAEPGTVERPAMEPPTWAQQRADALGLIAETALKNLDPGAPGERYQVVVHVDAAVLADAEAPGQSVLEEGARVSGETSQRLACDASRVMMRHDEDCSADFTTARCTRRAFAWIGCRTASRGSGGRTGSERLDLGYAMDVLHPLAATAEPVAQRFPPWSRLPPEPVDAERDDW